MLHFEAPGRSAGKSNFAGGGLRWQSAAVRLSFNDMRGSEIGQIDSIMPDSLLAMWSDSPAGLSPISPPICSAYISISPIACPSHVDFNCIQKNIMA